uniref:Uncharacterized protein n=1 Tax=Onchocerca volvulus TaxID=6282 RepID=A0A8R1TXN5_ONCVO
MNRYSSDTTTTKTYTNNEPSLQQTVKAGTGQITTNNISKNDFKELWAFDRAVLHTATLTVQLMDIY